METSITYTLTFDEYHSGVRLARLHLTGKSGQAYHHALAKIGFILLFIVLLLVVASYVFAGVRFDSSQVILFASAALLMGTLYTPFMERQWDRRIYKDERRSAPTTLSLGADHVSILLPDAVQVRIPWSSFTYIESERLMVLLTPSKWLLLPKKDFPVDAITDIRTIVTPSKGKF